MYSGAYLTRELPGVGGDLKVVPEDFVVHEIPLYPALGEGEHVYALIEKRGMTTFEAIDRIAHALGLPDRALGYAGLKDSRAVTRQTVSIHGADPKRVERLKIPGITVLSVEIHRNKLRPGHLRGNRFRIRVRDAVEGAADLAAPILDYLVQRGVPNAFGSQRFGSRRDAHRIGRALLLGDPKDVVDLIVGRPTRYERNVAVLDARRKYERGDLEGALDRFPPNYGSERAILRGLLGSGGRYAEAIKRIPKKMRKLYLAAFQSHLFNLTLWRRIDSFDTLMDGDLAYLHEGGAVFRIEEGEAGTEEVVGRTAAFEISPSGPLHGYKMPQPMGAPRYLEDEVVRDEGIDPLELSRTLREARLTGERRSLRIPISETSIEVESDGSLVVGFVLPRGSYATVVLREVMKSGDDAVLLEAEPRSDESV